MLSILFPTIYRRKLVESNINVIAFDYGEGTLHYLWLSILLLFAGLIIVSGPYQQRLPVFGRADVTYGPPAYPRTYPLLMKNKPKFWKAPKKTAQKKKLIAILSTALVVAFVFFCRDLSQFSLWKVRVAFRRDGEGIQFS